MDFALSGCSIRRVRSAGFSLVELMVAVVIGLIGTIVIFQVFAVFEGQKRTTTSAGDAQQNGLLALFSIERDARMAGYGLTYIPLLGCNVVAYDSTGTRDFTFPLAAVQIVEGAAGAPDSVTFTYGTSSQLIAPAKLIVASPVGGLFSKIDSVYGYRTGDLVIVGNSGPSPPPNCNMRQLSAVPPGSAAPDQIEHTAGRYNKAGGLSVAYPLWDMTTQTGGRLYAFGAAPPAAGAPVVGTYSVQNGQLMYQNLISDGAASAIVDGIVQLQAQYGLDDDGDGIIQSTEWRNGCAAATPPQIRKGASPGACATATSTDWSRVIAVRMAVLARSAQPEKPDPVTLLCNTTAAVPAWSGGTLDPGIADPGAWQCYRYRVFETKVAVRNLIWMPQ